jgi:hypothetical protein
MHDQLALYAARARQVVRQQRTACAVDGPAGIGKSHTWKTVAAEEGKHIQLVSTTAAGLVQSLFKYAGADAIAFDDFDAALRSEATANVVKMMTAPERRRTIVHQTVESIKNAARPKGPLPHIAPPTFHVRCGLIMLTNVDMSDPKAIDAAMRPHVAALIDRGVEFVHINRELRWIADYVVWLATEGDIFKSAGIDIDKSQLAQVVKFFTDNLERFQTVSVRRIQSIAMDRVTMPDAWQRLQQATFKPTKPKMTDAERKQIKADIEIALIKMQKRAKRELDPDAEPELPRPKPPTITLSNAKRIIAKVRARKGAVAPKPLTVKEMRDRGIATAPWPKSRKNAA